MNKRISRNEKKKLKIISLCHTGNPDVRKTKFSKKSWLEMKIMYKEWLSVFSMEDRKLANKVHRKYLR
jgi:hypothetical protein